jgi:hypothetical protein
MAVSLPEGEIAEATTSGDTSWAGDATTVNDPSDLLDFMKNVLLVVRLAFRVWSCKDDITWMTDHRSCVRNSVRQGTWVKDDATRTLVRKESRRHIGRDARQVCVPTLCGSG